MALQKNITLENGLEVTVGYWRIEQFSGDRSNVNVTVQCYLDANAASLNELGTGTNKPPITSKSYTFPTPNTASNMFAEAYAFLKTQDFFVDATDV